MRKKLALAVVGLVALSGLAQAEVADSVQIRQAGMDLMQAAYNGLSAMIAAKSDPTKMEQPAKAMARYMSIHPELFPPGSDKGKTRALSAIWSDNAGFRKDASEMVAAANKLAELAKAGNAEGAAAQLKVVADACTACHRTYRAR